MSRSIKHTPISGWASCRSMSWFRSSENRAFRHRVRQLIVEQKYDLIPHCKEYQNEWDSPRDGKMYFGHMLSLTYRCSFCECFGRWRGSCYCQELKDDYKKYMRK